MPEDIYIDSENELTEEEFRKLQEEKENLYDRMSSNHRAIRSAQKFGLNILIICIFLFFMFKFFFGLITAPNADMTPRIDAGDVLMYYRLENNYRLGDVVAYKKNGTEYIGRIIAQAGDTVDITDDGRVRINDQILQELNIYSGTVKYEDYVEYPYTVPSGSYWIMVDDRGSGEDSRCFGAIPASSFEGVVITLIRRNNI